MKTFAAFIGHKIALYGLGDKTRKILESCDKYFDIIGLLDENKTEGVLYGKPIIPLKSIKNKNIEAIIIIARPSSTLIIANRVREFCTIRGVRLFDSEGRDLLAYKSQFKPKYEKIDRDEVIGRIQKHDIISFDVFDTLLMREVLQPADVFYFAERKLPSEIRKKIPFANARQVAESELSQGAIPTWEAIYQYIGKRYHLSDQDIEILKKTELEIEKAVLIPRVEICKLFHYALSIGKSVIIVSDMYFSSEHLDYILKANEIEGYKKIFVSSTYGVDKNNGLFNHVVQEMKTSHILHIGDDKIADVVSPQKYGVTTMHIPSAMEFWQDSDFFYISEKIHTPDMRLKVGMFIAIWFNSPFLMDILSPEQIGGLFFAPLLVDFILWLKYHVVAENLHTILFAARDGFFIKALYDKLQGLLDSFVTESIYFLTSRRSAVSASLKNKEDIEKIAAQPFSGSQAEMLRTRFYLTQEEVQNVEDISKVFPLILQRSNELHDNYSAYIKTLSLKPGKKAFVDFVATGTCQNAVEKIMGEKMKGFYFLRLPSEEKEKKELGIDSLFNENKNFFEDYFIMEQILTSGRPSLQRFRSDGVPEYEPEIPSEDEINFATSLYDGIEKYFCRYIAIAGADAEFHPDISGEILHLIRKLPIPNKQFMDLKWNDSFYSRTALMREMM